MDSSTTHPAWQSLMLGLCILCATSVLPADDELARRATWSIPKPSEVRSRLDDYLEKQDLDPATREKIDAMWSNADEPRPPSERLENLAATFALVADEARELVEFCNAHSMPPMLPEFSVLESPEQPDFVRHNLRLLFGQWLARHRYYDEALETLDDLEPEDVVDPAALLFYQATGYHRMPDKNQCLPLVSKLLERQEQIPRRYAAVAELIQADLKPLQTDSLDEISRLMDEVQRRLDLKRAGKRVRDQEEQVVAKLDKLIKKLEEQQQQQAAAAGGSISSSRPAQDSMPLGGQGPGKVDPKSIGTGSGWGNLPPKERQEALQQIGKDLPAHYREVIEEYFRKLAREADADG
ncbi:MAG: hypothetical protein ACQESR_18210 [Planctomycetota bacterium]